MKKLIAILLGLTVFFFFAGIFAAPASAKNDNIKLKVFVHYPKNPGQPLAALTCDVTTNDQANDYLWAGWMMPTNGLTYKINLGSKPKNLSNAQIQGAMANSFATWTSADSKQIFNYGGSTSVKAAKYDRTNAILWKGITSSALAIT